MRIAALIKQIPPLEEMELGVDGRLRRDVTELGMNPARWNPQGDRQSVAAEVPSDRHHGSIVLAINADPNALRCGHFFLPRRA